MLVIGILVNFYVLCVLRWMWSEVIRWALNISFAAHCRDMTAPGSAPWASACTCGLSLAASTTLFTESSSSRDLNEHHVMFSDFTACVLTLGPLDWLLPTMHFSLMQLSEAIMFHYWSSANWNPLACLCVTMSIQTGAVLFTISQSDSSH